ncbi:MAG: L-seryl-tRNA(Sec) selenium transferase [Syntrophobacterales bacterium]|nr:L-seryl-tRNA(Sec) selenium transferase [Syntrophobacterales bacterium]
MDERKQELLRDLPKIDDLLLRIEKQEAAVGVSREMLRDVCRTVVEGLRGRIIQGGDELRPLPTPEQAADQALKAIAGYRRFRLRRVINATGVILHTNLGRAPLCREAMERVLEVASGYSNLEYNLEKGERGIRYDNVKGLLCALCGAEDALVVNNNAAAVLLVLNSLALNREAIVSRGELVEIGGAFRIPDVMEKSGARLVEVGTTNRTRLADYERAVCPDTGILLKVHTSNFKIVGFTEETDRRQLVELGKKHGVPVVEDLGSGCLIELNRYGREREQTVRDSLAAGVDVVSFSGDKLLGGPQAGIILGKKKFLEKIARNPLNRALRIDKLTLAALEGTLVKYLRPDEAIADIPVLHALTESVAAVEKRAKKLRSLLRRHCPAGVEIRLVGGFSMAGGGSLPVMGMETALVGIRADCCSAAEIERGLRKSDPPVIVRVADDQVLLDPRTLRDVDFKDICAGLQGVLRQSKNGNR